MNILLIVAAVVALAALVLLVGGRLVPRDHVVSRSVRLRARDVDVFALITDFAGQAAWRKGLKKIEILPPSDGKTVIRETLPIATITVRVEESVAPQRLVLRILEDAAPFGGTWTFELAPDGDGCRVTITEAGCVKPPALRFLARFVLGYAAPIDGYLRSLAKKLGEEAVPAAA